MLSSEDKHSLIERLVVALNESGWDGAAVAHLYKPDTVLHTFPEWPGVSLYHGRDGIKAVVAEWTESFDDLHLELVRMTDAGERVVILGWQSGRSRGQGVPAKIQLGAVAAFGDELISETWFFLSWAEALREAGIEE